MTCDRCGRDVIRHFAGSVEILRHAVAPDDAHYPRLAASPRSPEQAPPPESSKTVASPAVPVPGLPANQLPAGATD